MTIPLKVMSETEPLRVCYSYAIVCLSAQSTRRKSTEALVSGLSPAQADKLWYNYFIPPLSDIVNCEIFRAKDAFLASIV